MVASGVLFPSPHTEFAVTLIRKVISWFLRLTIKLVLAFAVITMLIAVKDAMNEGADNVLTFLWHAFGATLHDVWIVGAHFLHQSGDNLAGLMRNAEFDKGFNPFRWFLGVPVYIFVAFCQTGVWWLSHGSTVDGVMYAMGVPILVFLVLPHLGSIGGGSGGGGSKGGGGGGGHH